jgi:hypothetical protein
VGNRNVEVHEGGRTILAWSGSRCWRPDGLFTARYTRWRPSRTDGSTPGVEAWHPYQSLLRSGPDGSIIWREELPSGETLNGFTATRREDGKLIAQGWPRQCVLEPETGHISQTTFTK